ncbi:hypothetical protein OG401_11885 [Kitasatospora purpeofusca]|uniref:hypothetical protein n=1 Tax=Kitasatospora purpeofusca TaxID=67352 RepID=UPI00224DECA9|nr:hypothetical protein [Kitasatospora purpeofusca]MCX4685000.1 hypothetical protein [Kitasatospora purpeofusca]
MPADEVLRPGRDGATVDLVFESGGGSWPAAVLLVLRALAVLLAVGVAFLPAAILVVAVAVIVGATFVGAVTVCGALWAAAVLLLWPFLAVAEVRSVRRVQFAPAGAPTELRFVRGARAGAWAPISGLRLIQLDESVEEPYEGDPAPAVRTLTVTVVTSTGGEGPRSAPKGTDVDALQRFLEDLLGPVGVAVVRRTERRARRRPRPPSGGGWVYGGSGSANSGGGFSGGG